MQTKMYCATAGNWYDLYINKYLKYAPLLQQEIDIMY